MGIAERLRYARERAKLTGAEVEKLTNIGPSSLSDFENGKREPKLSQLQALAALYQRSIAFLMAEEPIPHEVVLWRERPTESAAEIEPQFLRLCTQYHNLEVWSGELDAGSLPEAQSRTRDFTHADAEELAKDVRRKMQLGDQPGHELLHALEENYGVKIFHRHFKPTGTAASTKSERLGMAILLNAGNSRWRRNFDLAHELFHLLTWSVFRKDAEASSSVAGEQEEKLAMCFARNLLMPEDALRTALNRRAQAGKVRYEALYDVARLFDVSVDALLWRMHYLYNRGSAGVDQTRREIEHAKAYAPSLEDKSREDPSSPKWPERYRTLAVKALWDGEISIGRFAEYLEIGRQEAARYVEQEVVDREEVPIAPA